MSGGRHRRVRHELPGQRPEPTPRPEPTQADLRRALRFGAMGAEQPTDARASEIRGWIDGSGGSESTQSNDRAPPVAHERAEQIALTRAVQTRWYAPGYRHIEQAVATGSSAQERAGSRNRKAGVRPGVPDVWLHIPVTEKPKADDDPSLHVEYLHPIRGVLELKRPDLRPKREVDPWWFLEWVPEHAGSTRYGLTGAQALELQLLDASGYHARVAYGHEQALALLDSIAGPEREVVWPMYASERRAIP